ncbi:hypothetical protein EVAR_78240_1 [Eumeta japonica]|uniref:Mariner Mos1 transposase n=1 Tax=Eumeta variegata TaxID=151549 RepID=A0A4C1T5U8_EUMVA|nr:hypothetical protein EVAR_78240_1 [Eumeta japonica]
MTTFHHVHARQLTNYSGTLGIEINISHPPHSPDLALCDFYLFAKIKRKLTEKWFTDVEEAVAAYEKDVEATSECERVKCFSQWFHRRKAQIH